MVTTLGDSVGKSIHYQLGYVNYVFISQHIHPPLMWITKLTKEIETERRETILLDLKSQLQLHVLFYL